MAYKHRDIVIAWMDGETIQYRDSWGQWLDLAPFLPTLGFTIQAFSEDKCYRIKPKPVIIRHYIYKDATTPHPLVLVKGYNNKADDAASMIEKNTNIIWLDYWHEASFSAPEA